MLGRRNGKRRRNEAKKEEETCTSVLLQSNGGEEDGAGGGGELMGAAETTVVVEQEEEGCREEAVEEMDGAEEPITEGGTDRTHAWLHAARDPPGVSGLSKGPHPTHPSAKKTKGYPPPIPIAHAHHSLVRRR